jgi:hypothetical protein
MDFVPSFPAETLLHCLLCVRCLGLKTLSNQLSLWAQFEWVLDTVIDEEGSTMSPRVDVTALTAVTLAGQRWRCFQAFPEGLWCFSDGEFVQFCRCSSSFFLMFTLNILNIFLEQGGYNLLLLVNFYCTWVEFVWQCFCLLWCTVSHRVSRADVSLASAASSSNCGLAQSS